MSKMNGKLLTTLVVGCCTATGVAYAQMGQQPTETQPEMQQSSEMQQAQIKKASEVMGKTVRDEQGQELGQIEDLAIDVQKGELAYVALSTGGTFEAGRMVGVPVDKLQADPQQDGFTASISSQELEQAQELPEDNWPAQPTLTAGVSQPGATTAESNIKRASELMGTTVKGSQGEELGEIDDFALDMQQGKLAYVVLSTGGMFQEKLVGVPATALQSDPQTDEYVANISQQEIEQAQELPEDNWPQQPTVAASGTAPGVQGQTQDFASLDQDGDGYISQQEAQAGQGQLSQQFDQIDENADQQIDRSEFAVFEETSQPTEQPSEWQEQPQTESEWQEEQQQQDY